jgi:hypothetical protein
MNHAAVAAAAHELNIVVGIGIRVRIAAAPTRDTANFLRRRLTHGSAPASLGQNQLVVVITAVATTVTTTTAVTGRLTFLSYSLG